MMVGAVLLAFAGALAVVVGVIGLAHIQPAWLRWTAMIVYVAVLTAMVFGLPLVLEATL